MKISYFKIFLVSISLSATLLGWGQTPPPMADNNKVVDRTLDSLNVARSARPVAGSSRVGDNPVLFLVGNSTMRTGTKGNGDNGQWGWGFYAGDFFDPAKITVENHALGGTSSRTFYNLLWADVLKGVRKGDWVVIELGHNDNGPYDSGRARASIPGTSRDSIEVTIAETGKREVVYSYGEYMRKYINDVRARGANPLLLSITPRNSWDESGRINRVDKTFGLWAKEIAQEMNVPFIDLNDITASKYEKFGAYKVDYMFYVDAIHTSAFGAKVNAESAIEGIRAQPNLGLNAYLKPQPENVAGRGRKVGKPVIFTIGDSTVKNRDDDSSGMWGWGSVLHEFVRDDAAVVDNQAMAGRSSRTYMDEGRWERVYDALQPGDIVFIQFGHNDSGDINVGKARGTIIGSGSESMVMVMEPDRRNQVIYTFGWYIRKYIGDALEKGAIPVVLSYTPRERWDKEGRVERNNDTYGLWSRVAVEAMGGYFVDLNDITATKFEAAGAEAVTKYFNTDHTHTSLQGAHINAASVVEGVKALDNSYIRDLFK